VRRAIRRATEIAPRVRDRIRAHHPEIADSGVEPISPGVFHARRAESCSADSDMIPNFPLFCRYCY
jgi:hypothetical protein